MGVIVAIRLITRPSSSSIQHTAFSRRIAMSLEPNKIHHIPGTFPSSPPVYTALTSPLVRVTYTLPSPAASPTPFFSTGYTPLPLAEDSTYTTSCEGLVPVFVHDAPGSRRRKVKTEDGAKTEDRVASVCLKSLVKAICLSR